MKNYLFVYLINNDLRFIIYDLWFMVLEMNNYLFWKNIDGIEILINLFDV